jgi:hypothetical protein
VLRLLPKLLWINLQEVDMAGTLTEADRLKLMWFARRDIKNMSIPELEEYSELLEEKLKELEEEERSREDGR